MYLLTKSKYLAGLQCPRYLWALIHNKEKIPEPDASAQFIMNEGTQVGELAKQLFPGGIDISAEDFKGNLKKSKELLREKKPLFEAGFQFENCFSRADILIPSGDAWDIIEVKGGTSVKEINLHDVSFQKYCYEGEGIKIRKCFLLHLNKDYVRNGPIDIKKLFVLEDITPHVNELMKDIKNRINLLLEAIDTDSLPEMNIGPRCKDPHECPLGECWDFLPENHVFHLYRGGKLSLQLFEEGIHAIEDIPDRVKLNGKQKIQIDCEKERKVHVDKKKIKSFLNTFKYPVYYLDFETFSTATPMFNGLKPYSHVPFQFSLHVATQDGKTKHHSFLYNGTDDPRPAFLQALKAALGTAGSIIVYNQSFEIARLKELAESFPEHKNWVKQTLTRVIDLLNPFRDFAYYNSLQKGSASIKKVLPAVTGKSYDGMEIANGGTASVEFFNSTYKDVSEEQKKRTRENLLKYCELDTLAEVMIVNKLNEMVK